MEFNGNKAIYLQICDAICEQILSGGLRPDERIPSVREYGADIGVNPNTIMRSYEKLTNEGIIYNKRGIGYFISADAREMVLEAQRKEFIADELPQIIRRAALLELDLISLLSHATPSESSPQA
jgi:DNA-binding transcriptional regulator YhcF (GntR family)